MIIATTKLPACQFRNHNKPNFSLEKSTKAQYGGDPHKCLIRYKEECFAKRGDYKKDGAKQRHNFRHYSAL
jgi:hypothetical protein